VIFHDESEGTVSFVGPTGTFSAGDVPEGAYELVARFPGRETPLTRSVVLVPGATYTVRCSARMFRCDLK
jgi:hypothetical protein